MDIKELNSICENIKKLVEKLQNTNLEVKKKLVTNNTNVNLGLCKDMLKNIFLVEEIKSVREFLNTSSFNKEIKIFFVKGVGLILQKC